MLVGLAPTDHCLACLTYNLWQEIAMKSCALGPAVADVSTGASAGGWSIIELTDGRKFNCGGVITIKSDDEKVVMLKPATWPR